MKCVSGKEKNPKTGRCIKKCSPPNTRNLNTMRCVKECEVGKIRNPVTGRCVKSFRKKKISKSLKKKLSIRSPSPKKTSSSPKLNPFNFVIKCDGSSRTKKECNMSLIIKGQTANTVYKNKDCIDYKKGLQIGDDSSFGTVFNTCCGKRKVIKEWECRNITKIVNFKKLIGKTTTRYEAFITEITAQQIASTHNIAPPIQKVYVSDDYGVIIMDKMFMTFDQYVDEFVLNDNEKDIKKEAIRLAKMIDNFHVQLHNLGIYHCDMKGDNVMIDSSGNWKVIDFGVSTIVSDNVFHKNLFNYEYRMIKDSKQLFITGQPNSPEREFYKIFVKELTSLRKLEEDRMKNKK